MSDADVRKISELNNPYVEQVLEEYINMCAPDRVIVVSDSREDITMVREMAQKNGEESKLAIEGHTVHFDGIYDLARDTTNTRILVTPDMKKMSKVIRTIDKREGLEEVFGIMKGIMKGKTALVRFFCLGPINSRFSLPSLQITDSTYVAHSEDLLYRSGYEEFRRLKGSKNFFYFVHSAGELDERGSSRNTAKRRMYIDVAEGRVFTMNNQYAGNSLGLKKLALRLAIYKANNEDWLAEHMFVMGVRPEGKNRTTYFTGAYPSACGKTSTAMVPGQLILGDDIAYLRRGKGGEVRAVNVEQGIFGIIEDVNPVDDPVIYTTLTTPRELIFSNVLIKEKKPYWLGMGMELPKEGFNYSGDWKEGDTDKEGNPILPAHKNARYTVRISELENADPKLHEPEGVEVRAVIYGGRDSDTSVPVYEAFEWTHGVFMGASVESETTAATIGKAGVRTFNPMANIDFLVVPLGKYIENHLKFGKSLKEQPRVYATNYFLKEEGKFLNEKVDKKVWLLWMEGRVHGEYGAIETPIGFIPKFEDVRDLFQKVFNREYSRELYDRLFSIRIDKFLEKLDRIEGEYSGEADLPAEFTGCMKKIRQNLLDARGKYGKDVVSPGEFV
ncbi:MAG: phosphoenolpyruvate carboxykinase (GTP) [Spirochaetes bacterium]|nr:phosphoenolpyruvate carboxykinase (GTP) [Spirochaetota bacterium]